MRKLVGGMCFLGMATATLTATAATPSPGPAVPKREERWPAPKSVDRSFEELNRKARRAQIKLQRRGRHA